MLSAMNRCLLITALGLATVATGCASYEIDGFAGYTSVQAESPDGVSPFFDDDAGLRLAANGSRSLVTPGFVRGEGGNGLRGNINVSASRYDGDSGAELLMVSPQIGPSFRLSAAGIFAEAGATAGGVYANIDSDADADGEFSYAYRPYLRGGFVGDTFIFGLEGGYEGTGLDFAFDASGEDYENWYVGAFFGIRLTK